MVLGDVYLIPTKEYDDDASKDGNVAFNKINVEKYIEAFQAINGRANQNDEKYKYERCCLLVVDFDKVVPKIYNTSTELYSTKLKMRKGKIVPDCYPVDSIIQFSYFHVNSV